MRCIGSTQSALYLQNPGTRQDRGIEYSVIQGLASNSKDVLQVKGVEDCQLSNIYL